MLWSTKKLTLIGLRFVYIVRESPTEEGVSWQKITEFDAQNMARAFEYYDGYFYFGLGFNNEDNVGEAGLLVRLKYDLASQ